MAAVSIPAVSRPDAFADQWNEVTDVPLEVRGTLPAGLVGTLHRITPTGFQWAKGRYQHWFDGHGQVHAVTLASGQARYTNRFVQTKALAESRRLDAPTNGYGTLACGWRRFTAFGSTANTNVLQVGEKVLALQEMSAPYALAAGTLATIGQDDLGFLGPDEGFSAHPRVVGDRVVSANLELGRVAQAHVTVLGRDLRLAHQFRVPLPFAPVLLHDIGLSARHIVIPVFPHVVNPLALLARLKTLGFGGTWRPELGTHVVVTDHEGGRLRRYELPAMWSFHVLNCFDEGDTVVLDLITYATGDAVAAVGRLPVDGADARLNNRLQRLRLYPDGRHTLEVLHAGSAEFPRVDPRDQGQPYTHGFMVGAREAAPRDAAGFSGAVLRVDLAGRTTQSWVAPAGQIVGEAVPVVRPDGPGVWLLSLVYDPEAHRSRVVVLAGEDVEAGPVAELLLPHHVPPGFHGNFSAARACGFLPDGRRHESA